MSSRAPTYRHLAVIAFAITLSACGGGGGGGGGTPPPSGNDVTVSGRITFDRAPFEAQIGGGLDPSNPVESAARQVVVEAIDASTNAILASTTTDNAGDYSLIVPANRNVFIRAKAQMLKTGTAPTWNFRVLNNTNSDALYALDGNAFDSGTANATRNLHAPSGWGTSSYTGTRAAAPFAVLDAVFSAKELVLSAAPTAVFPALDLFWSGSNRPAEPLCPDLGDIETTFYQTAGRNDQCATTAELPAGIYILGDFASGAGDTDEFDRHVIAHEFGHYFEDRFSRSDSLGGSHGPTDLLDMRVAFGEGWGNAYSAMALGDPEYRDSRDGISADFGFNVENDEGTSAEGWFSEASIGEILWDIYDAGSEPGDTVELGFIPIFEVMTGPQVVTEALTSIFTFAEAIRDAEPDSAAAIDTLLSGEEIASVNEFGEGEDNDGGDERVIPIYGNIELNTSPVSVCTTAGSLDSNKLGNRKFLRFSNSAAREVTIQATGAAAEPGTVAATDPDIFVFQRGEIVAAGLEGTPPNTTPARETLEQISLDAGLHIIEVYDFDLKDEPSTTRCMTVAITGS